MKNWTNLKKELLADKEVVKEYDNLAPKYTLISQLIEARLKKGLTQEQLAKRIGTKQPAIARLESGSTNVSLAFLEKITQALDTELVIKII